MNRIALVTGAGSGIGQAVSLALLQAQWDVVLAGRRGEPLQATADLTSAGSGRCGEATVVPCDVTDEASVEGLFGQIESRFGRLDLLVNNAGAFGPSRPIDEVSLDEWQRTVDVNLTGSWLCARAAFGLMKRQQPPGGRIINNGSLSAYTPRPGSSAYTATKHAITGLTKSLALDGRPFGIACGQIDVGNAATAMTAAMTAAMSVGVPQADGTLAVEPTMDVAAVAASVLHMAQLPLDANVLFMTVMATAMPYVGRG